MNDRPRIQRALLRRALRKQIRSASEKQASRMRMALDDEAVFETVYESALIEAQEYGAVTGEFVIAANDVGEPLVDNLLKLLQWFIDHGSTLIEIIEIIVDLFGGTAVARTICDDETLFAD